MHSTHDGEEEQCACSEIAAETDEVEKEADEQNPFPWKAVDEESAERSDQKSRDGVAGEHQANHVLTCTEAVGQVEREQRCEQIESE